MSSIAWAVPSVNTSLAKDFSAERHARTDERKQRHGLQIASPSGTVRLAAGDSPMFDQAMIQAVYFFFAVCMLIATLSTRVGWLEDRWELIGHVFLTLVWPFTVVTVLFIRLMRSR